MWFWFFFFWRKSTAWVITFYYAKELMKIGFLWNVPSTCWGCSKTLSWTSCPPIWLHGNSHIRVCPNSCGSEYWSGWYWKVMRLLMSYVSCCSTVYTTSLGVSGVFVVLLVAAKDPYDSGWSEMNKSNWMSWFSSVNLGSYKKLWKIIARIGFN